MKANLTLFFLAVFLIAAWAGREWPNIAKIMPVYVAAIPGLVLRPHQHAILHGPTFGVSVMVDFADVPSSQILAVEDRLKARRDLRSKREQGTEKENCPNHSLQLLNF